MKMQQKPVGSRGTVAAMIWSLEFRLRRSCRVDERGIVTVTQDWIARVSLQL